MIQELRQQAYNDLITTFWDSSKSHFKYSQNENITSPAIIAVCLMAIESMGEVGDKWIDAHKLKLEKSLLKNAKWTDAGGHYENTMATAFGVLGLNLLKSTSPRIVAGHSFLLDSQLENGSWSFLGATANDEEDHPYFTYWSVRALLCHEESHALWKNTIRKAFYYLCEAAVTYSSRPTTYCMIRHGLYLIKTRYEEWFDENDKKAIASIHNYKIERHQRKDGTWKQEPEVVSRANFRKSLFTMKNLYFLSEMRYKTISDIHSSMVSWIDVNYRAPGWGSDTEASRIGVSWATAYVLLGLSSFDSAIKSYIGE